MVFKNSFSYIIMHTKTSSLTTHQHTAALAAGLEAFIHSLLCVFCICCLRDHKNTISSLHVAKCQPHWSFYISSLSSRYWMKNWLNELTDRMKDSRSAMHSPLPAVLWNPKCTIHCIVSELCLAMSFRENAWQCFHTLTMKKHQIKSAMKKRAVYLLIVLYCTFKILALLRCISLHSDQVQSKAEKKTRLRYEIFTRQQWRANLFPYFLMAMMPLIQAWLGMVFLS